MREEKRNKKTKKRYPHPCLVTYAWQTRGLLCLVLVRSGQAKFTFCWYINRRSKTTGVTSFATTANNIAVFTRATHRAFCTAIGRSPTWGTTDTNGRLHGIATVLVGQTNFARGRSTFFIGICSGNTWQTRGLLFFVLVETRRALFLVKEEERAEGGTKEHRNKKTQEHRNTGTKVEGKKRHNEWEEEYKKKEWWYKEIRHHLRISTKSLDFLQTLVLFYNDPQDMYRTCICLCRSDNYHCCRHCTMAPLLSLTLCLVHLKQWTSNNYIEIENNIRKM